MTHPDHNSPEHFTVASKPMLQTVTPDLIATFRARIMTGVVPPDYPSRPSFNESDAMWNSWPEDYSPHFVTSHKNQKPWPQTPHEIRPEDRDFFAQLGCKFGEGGWPLMPFGRTGYTGAGRMPGIGFSRAVDTFMTRHNPSNGDLEFTAFTRSDMPVVAIPGGKLDPIAGPNQELLGYEDIDTGTIRELTEEVIDTDADSDAFEKELAAMKARLQPIYDGWVVNMGPRTTDHASFTTYAQRLHLSPDEAQTIVLKEAPGETEDVEWVKATDESVRRLFAMQGEFGLMAIAQLHDSGMTDDIETDLRDAALRVQDAYHA